MNNFEKGMKILEEKFGNHKDNVLGLATISETLGASGKPRPIVRDVDAFFLDGAFYTVTHAKSSKMQQIALNNEVAIAVNFAWFTASGTGENMGWVLKPENAEIRTHMRKAFAEWYERANNENDENCCILKVTLTNGIINLNHHETLIHMNFANKTAEIEGKPL
ncbi:MAG: pyridoxamine 5'-phosphate oxidase family protein [Defluviitaleaceae bacterium]|nr:pyridoxamine 5'-phosphate oxidase family protein [Defluviitaleaceae bacterium]MCL2274361.1 pyridoxamine 5'-phosphate oxidase family protein [Defluviitaleaceae bacterium]